MAICFNRSGRHGLSYPSKYSRSLYPRLRAALDELESDMMLADFSEIYPEAAQIFVDSEFDITVVEIFRSREDWPLLNQCCWEQSNTHIQYLENPKLVLHQTWT